MPRFLPFKEIMITTKEEFDEIFSEFLDGIRGALNKRLHNTSEPSRNIWRDCARIREVFTWDNAHKKMPETAYVFTSAEVRCFVIKCLICKWDVSIYNEHKEAWGKLVDLQALLPPKLNEKEAGSVIRAILKSRYAPFVIKLKDYRFTERDDALLWYLMKGNKHDNKEHNIRASMSRFIDVLGCKQGLDLNDKIHIINEAIDKLNLPEILDYLVEHQNLMVSEAAKAIKAYRDKNHTIIQSPLQTTIIDIPEELCSALVVQSSSSKTQVSSENMGYLTETILDMPNELLAVMQAHSMTSLPNSNESHTEERENDQTSGNHTPPFDMQFYTGNDYVLYPRKRERTEKEDKCQSKKRMNNNPN